MAVVQPRLVVSRKRTLAAHFGGGRLHRHDRTLLQVRF